MGNYNIDVIFVNVYGSYIIKHSYACFGTDITHPAAWPGSKRSSPTIATSSRRSLFHQRYLEGVLRRLVAQWWYRGLLPYMTQTLIEAPVPGKHLRIVL